jgi:branched-chain amino acid transport system substrate-binding protein
MPALLLRYSISLVLVFLAFCAPLYLTALKNQFYRPDQEERSQAGAQWRTKGIAVAVVWPPHKDLSFVHGVIAGIEEINAQHGPVAGKIHLRTYDEDSVEVDDDAGGVARQVVKDPNAVAVLGHEFSETALPASLTYEHHGILFLTPKSTDPQLTTHGFRFLFRLTPSDRDIADAMTAVALKQNWKKLGIFYARTPAAESLEQRIIASAEDRGMSVVFARSYLPHDADESRQDFRPMIADVPYSEADAVMIADRLPRGGRLVKDLARMGVSMPLIAGDKMDSDLLWTIAGEAANNVYVASAVDPDTDTPEFLAFKASFLRRWGMDPGYGACQGYIAIKLLAEAVTESGTADPLILANTLRTRTWNELFGDFKFSSAGDVQGRIVSVKHMEGGRFVTVPF